ncbi:beta-1,3-galactosyltransferase 2-like [Carassius auratus]|uniref:Hexosyltransferase n=1 Tax=Carassius auratus TaxID=7957 RepID=A0A6P6J1I1_CARAU|nr:beta-1,3-galactosyltransferase 2-like [Carassius auratus]XP_026053917.1 beta-1,3-galactosyltransferase 2-like [Carassius auratus]
MYYNKSVLFFLLVPGTSLLLYLSYSYMTLGQYKKEPQRYPLPKRQNTTAPKKDPVTEEPEIDQEVQEDPGLYHVAYPRKYKFIIDQPKICEEQKPFVVIIVPVPPWDLEARSGIRRTWGGEKLIGDKVVLVLFMIGLHNGNDQETLQEKLQNESQQYKDLLQSNFLDSYKNLTIKTMMMMEWLSRSCQQASFAVKVDADVLVNTNNLINMLVSLNPVPTNYMTGLVWYGNIVIRNPLNKFYLPYDVYPKDTYPPYPLGMCYIISLDLPQKFIQESKHIKAIFIEDAYLGLCLERMGIVPSHPPHIEQFVVNPPQYNRCYYSGLIAILTGNTNQMASYWTDIHSTSNPC